MLEFWCKRQEGWKCHLLQKESLKQNTFGGIQQGFSFDYVQFEIIIRYPKKHVEQAVRYMNLGFNAKYNATVWNSSGYRQYLMRQDELSQEMTVDTEDVQDLSH